MKKLLYKRKFFKIFFLILIIFAGSATITACGKTGLNDTKNIKTEKVIKKKSNQLRIGVSLSTLSNPAFIRLRNEIQSYAKKNGSKIVLVDAQNDAAKQDAQVEDLIHQKVDALIVNPCDSAAVSTAIQNANAAKIPVVCIDRGADRGKVVTTVSSDNVAGGRMAARYLIKTIGKDAKVAELQGIPGASVTRERGEGFDSIGDKELDIVTKQTAQFDRAKALTVTENILQAHPDIKGIFAHNDEEAIGAASAVKASKKKIVIVGFDGENDALNLIKDGQIKATIGQQWALMARTALKEVYDYYQGEKIEKNTKVPVKLVTKETVKNFK